MELMWEIINEDSTNTNYARATVRLVEGRMDASIAITFVPDI